jgi:hypothetical protein
MRGGGTKAERSDPTTPGEVRTSECPNEASPVDRACGTGEEPDCPLYNDWDEV